MLVAIHRLGRSCYFGFSDYVRPQKANGRGTIALFLNVERSVFEGYPEASAKFIEASIGWLDLFSKGPVTKATAIGEGQAAAHFAKGPVSRKKASVGYKNDRLCCGRERVSMFDTIAAQTFQSCSHYHPPASSGK